LKSSRAGRVVFRADDGDVARFAANLALGVQHAAQRIAQRDVLVGQEHERALGHLAVLILARY